MIRLFRNIGNTSSFLDGYFEYDHLCFLLYYGYYSRSEPKIHSISRSKSLKLFSRKSHKKGSRQVNERTISRVHDYILDIGKVEVLLTTNLDVYIPGYSPS